LLGRQSFARKTAFASYYDHLAHTRVLGAEHLLGGSAVHGMSTIRWRFSEVVPPQTTPPDEPDREATGIAGSLLRKVLVVDDEEDLAYMAEALLSSEGLDVVVAHSAIDALRILEKDADIDAVFSDVMMPGMTGLQLADAVRDMYPRVKIVLTSGYTMPALLAGRQTRYLFAPKPYRLDTIMKLLRS
jgi:two-component system OmpR family response regulator